MSTTFYTLRPPVTSLAVRSDGPHHEDLRVWVNGKLVGKLTVGKEEIPMLLNFFRGSEVTTRTALAGLRNSFYPSLTYAPDVMISEYGELVTKAELQEQAGETTDG